MLAALKKGGGKGQKKGGHFLATLSYVYKGNAMAGPFVSLEDNVSLGKQANMHTLFFIDIPCTYHGLCCCCV
jgi:hypothetical protein